LWARRRCHASGGRLALSCTVSSPSGSQRTRCSWIGVRDVVGLYLGRPERALVLCIDEKSQIQAHDRPRPILPMLPGVPERATHGYKRLGTSSLFAALAIASGKVIGSPHARHRTMSSRSSSCRSTRPSRTSWTSTSLLTTTPHTRSRQCSAGRWRTRKKLRRSGDWPLETGDGDTLAHSQEQERARSLSRRPQGTRTDRERRRGPECCFGRPPAMFRLIAVAQAACDRECRADRLLRGVDARSPSSARVAAAWPWRISAGHWRRSMKRS